MKASIRMLVSETFLLSFVSGESCIPTSLFEVVCSQNIIKAILCMRKLFDFQSINVEDYCCLSSGFLRPYQFKFENLSCWCHFLSIIECAKCKAYNSGYTSLKIHLSKDQYNQADPQNQWPSLSILSEQSGCFFMLYSTWLSFLLEGVLWSQTVLSQ